MDKHQQTSRHPKSSLTSETSHWTSSSLDSVPVFLQTPKLWFPNEKLNLLSSENSTLDHWATFQLFFSLAQVRFFWQCFCFSSLQSSLLLVHILPNFFLPVNFAFHMLWYSTPWTATPFSNAPLGLNLFVEGVNDRLLDHCQVSSVPHYCAFKEQELPRSFYWINVNIIFWDTDFWLALALSSNYQNKKCLKYFILHLMISKIYKSFTFWNKLQEKNNFFTIF